MFSTGPSTVQVPEARVGYSRVQYLVPCTLYSRAGRGVGTGTYNGCDPVATWSGQCSIESGPLTVIS